MTTYVSDDEMRAGLATTEATVALMNEDPAVAAGVFTFRAHPVRSFPGDSLT